MALCFFSTEVCGQLPKISHTNWEVLVPSDRLPKGVEVQKGNNNLDVTYFKGRFYFAFRTAPSHFASKKTRIYVLSSADREKWELEADFHLGADLREPRFAIFHDSLFFYFFEGGTNPLSFEPRQAWGSATSGNKDWKKARSLGIDGYVPWRFRDRNDTLYVSAYYGVNLYRADHQADLRLFYSLDGFVWHKISEKPQVGGRSGEEGEFIFDAKGNLWGTVRLESEGAYLVKSKANNISEWALRKTGFKYDSALLFLYKDEVYLVSRRNIEGEMDKAPRKAPYAFRKSYNLTRYSLTPKVTAIFRLDKEKMEMIHVLDIPSTGDTAFPGIIDLGNGRFWLLNYSSDLGGRPKNWISGQLAPTFIYACEIVFTD